LTPVTKPAVAAKVHQALDIDRNLAAKIAFDHIVAVDRLAYLQDFRISQFGDTPLGRDFHFFAKFLGLSRSNAVNILKRDDDTLVGWYINASDTSQNLFSISAARHEACGGIALIPRPVEAGPSGTPGKRQPGEKYPQTPSFQAEKSSLADRARHVNWPVMF
jgi:hypothetical protein